MATATTTTTTNNSNRNNNGNASAAGEITVTFLHPRDGKRFGAAVGRDLTGRGALDSLIGAGFIGPEGAGHAYTLTNDRTHQTIPLTTMLGEAGVQDGDLVAVNQVNEGHAA